MLQLAPGWTMAVERGPDWLFVRLSGSDSADLQDSGDLQETMLSDVLWSQLEQHLTYRLVLELQDVPLLCRETIDQLLLLQGKIDAQGGLLKVCGLSDENFEALNAQQSQARFPRYCNREEAVMGYPPNRPR